MADQRATLIDAIEQLFEQLTWRGRHHFARRVRTVGLTPPQYAALDMIERLGPNATMSAVGDALQIPPSSMTGIVDRLVRDGLVERSTLPNDRRAVGATITPSGTELVATVERARRADLAAMLGGLSEDDLGTFVHVLTRLSDGVARLLAESPPDSANDRLAAAGTCLGED